MKNNDNIVCIVAESGGGKTYLIQALAELGYTELNSYTTRKRRYVGEKGHTHISPERFDEIRNDLVAYTLFDNHEYGATRQQVKASQLYAIDPDGVQQLIENYGADHIYIVYLDVPKDERFMRLVEERGWDTAMERTRHDEEKFHLLHSNQLEVKEVHKLANENYVQFKDNIEYVKDLLERVFPN